MFDEYDDEQLAELIDAGEIDPDEIEDLDSEDLDELLEKEDDDFLETINVMTRLPDREVIVPQWEPIKGFKGYWISKMGKVKGPRGILKGRKNPLTGYWDVSLRGNVKYIHVLVFNQWKGKVRKGNVISHEDGNKDHNWLGNLEERTTQANMIIHAIQRKQKNEKTKRKSKTH